MSEFNIKPVADPQLVNKLATALRQVKGRPSEVVIVRIDADLRIKLSRVAIIRKCQLSKLCADILGAVASDDLFAAVLDDGSLP